MFSKARDPDQAGGEKVQTGSCRQRWYESYSCVPQFGDELWLLTEQARGSEAAFHGLLPEDDDLQNSRFRKTHMSLTRRVARCLRPPVDKRR